MGRIRIGGRGKEEGVEAGIATVDGKEVKLDLIDSMVAAVDPNVSDANNHTFYVTTNSDVRDDAMVVKFPAFDSKFVCLKVSA